ncbi:hypothetical protein PsexTeo8_19700 [Pseudomonas extremaustralis]|uniref:hypothetical protein n=1 Tax=Pseudomonas extremaustralis TaxID=359110 RepID=UPI002AA0C9F6|nr:hypothetical protein [Pseudomonas extremaustralis]MDY7065533.1 hypothetical protein [Pseudomonas extremaustralis]
MDKLNKSAAGMAMRIDWERGLSRLPTVSGRNPIKGSINQGAVLTCRSEKVDVLY